MPRLTNKEYKKLEDTVYNYKTKSEHGFRPEEETEILKLYPEIDPSDYYYKLGVNTCIMDDDGAFITYHCDVLNGLLCSLEDREQTLEEWD